jgi:hypothetical protein
MMNSILKKSSEGADVWADNFTDDCHRGRSIGMNAAANSAMIHAECILEDLEKSQKS